jgi:hypothetical protein
MKKDRAGSHTRVGNQVCRSRRGYGLPRDASVRWNGSASNEESTLHQLSPYIGKMKSKMASALVSGFTREGSTLYDPYCGSGTVALEGWISGRHVIGNDLSPYAVLLTRAKLSPLLSLDQAMAEIDLAGKRVKREACSVDLRRIPEWVRGFFHPETLRETIAWCQVLRSRRSFFLLSCLLGILHHQRPGFLSYPSSHTIPYLRHKKFPPDSYPELYEYRPLRERLERKAMRALKRIPQLDLSLGRECFMHNAARFFPRKGIDTIVTSPPYMGQLDYGRDNRLRLWFLGVQDWISLDRRVTPSETRFFSLFRSCLTLWQDVLSTRGLCVLVLGDVRSRLFDMPLADAVATLATKQLHGYSVLCKYTEPIPKARRVRRACAGSIHETVLVLRKLR